MRYFLDTEFCEDGKTIELLSIGVVSEDGREFYAENEEADWGKANDWVKQNVLNQLRHADWLSNVMKRSEIAEALVLFCDPSRYGKPEFWGYFSDYDWVVVAQLFGTMMDLPEDWPMYCLDIKQFAMSVGNPLLPVQGKNEHHALQDALWNRRAYDFLVAQSRRSM